MQMSSSAVNEIVLIPFPWATLEISVIVNEIAEVSVSSATEIINMPVVDFYNTFNASDLEGKRFGFIPLDLAMQYWFVKANLGNKLAKTFLFSFVYEGLISLQKEISAPKLPKSPVEIFALGMLESVMSKKDMIEIVSEAAHKVLTLRIQNKKSKRQSERVSVSKRGLGSVYLIECTPNNSVKIGFSTNLKERLEALQTANPCELKLVDSFEGTIKEEKELHEMFIGLRIHENREWFKEIHT